MEELLVVPGSGAVDSETSLAAMLNDLRALLSGQLGVPYLKYLIKWGFITGNLDNPAQTIDRKAFARYLTVIARGIMRGLLEERERVEQARLAARGGQA